MRVELIVADDGSSPEFRELNRKQATDFGAKYISRNENSGRSAIRNLLCREATFDNLLFLDCDSVITDESFLLNYLPYLNRNRVVYGGTLYQDKVPEKRYILHWKYGREREVKPADVRNSFPAGYFKTNNFLIPKPVLEQNPFDERLTGYGHEDTLMGITFYQKETEVIHIENPVIHAGLEDNHTFLSKTEEGIRNLHYLLNSGIDNDLLGRHIRILKVFAGIRRLGLVFPVKILWKILKPFLRYLILYRNSLQALDIYKLGFLCDIKTL